MTVWCIRQDNGECGWHQGGPTTTICNFATVHAALSLQAYCVLA